MVDPLSITTGVIGLVTQSVKTVQTIQNYVSKHKIADMTIASTRTECSAIRIALLRIQDLLTQNQPTAGITSTDSFATYALEEYEAVLSACSTAFSVLNARLEKLALEGLDENIRSSFKAKFNAVWNDEEVGLVRQNIRGQAIAINLLLSAFQADSSAKTYQLLKESKNRSILQAVSDDARTLFSRSHRARTITQRGDEESSGSVIGNEVFDFDDLVINSTAYRRAYHQYHSYSIKAGRTSDPEVEGMKEKEVGDKTQPNLNPRADFLVFHDKDYFDAECQRLCQQVQEWVRRFSKLSDMRACRLISEINNDNTIDRLDDTILDGSDVGTYLEDRVRRRDVFMSMVMALIWEYIFTRYLFGLDREQRQKLKSLEKTLLEVGPTSAVGLWRATTLNLLSRRESYIKQRDHDLQAVCGDIFQRVCEILPPPSQLEAQLQSQLARVLRSAVNLSIEMRTQRAEYSMLPPLQPQYDPNGDLTSKSLFNAALMNERSGMSESNEELESRSAIVRHMLFPLVVKKGDDDGSGDAEIVVYPSQVIAVPTKADNLNLNLNFVNMSNVSVAPSEIGTI